MGDGLGNPTADFGSLLPLLREHGMAVDHRQHVDDALKERRRTDTRALLRRAGELKSSQIEPKVPVGLAAADCKTRGSRDGVKSVATVKVTEQHDRRKRELGDEGESWAIASMVAKIAGFAPPDRSAVTDEVIAPLTGTSTDIAFECAGADGAHGSVESVMSHAEQARRTDLDDEKLIDELVDLLHVSKQSDGFGFET